MRDSSPGRSRARAGKQGESQAVAHLRGRGYRILEVNYRCKLGELDIVARQGSTLVFVEVRTRSSDRHGRAAESVNATKQHRISRAASYYIAARKPRFEACRFDVVDITAGDLQHLPDAFRLGDL